jgi:hypothetical protein
MQAQSKAARISAVKQVLAHLQPINGISTAPEMRLLTEYVLGHLTLAQANKQLRAYGLALRAPATQAEITK